ncbi:MAG TPA: zinc ribbon domain-containing protein [Gemmatimonadales bacterium]|jgi:hypothetical protein
MTCPTCHQEVDPDHRFCSGCGRPLLGPRAAKVSAILTDDFDIDALSKLQREKQRLTKELKQILDHAGQTGEVTTADQARYQELRGKWGQLTGEISNHMDYLEARREYERRHANRRHRDRRRQHSAIDFPERRKGDRRDNARRSGEDRRYPFD